jgi:hypothetical protein
MISGVNPAQSKKSRFPATPNLLAINVLMGGKQQMTIKETIRNVYENIRNSVWFSTRICDRSRNCVSVSIWKCRRRTKKEF